MRYLIWSNEHRGWWKPGRHGYTTATHRAGVYGFEEAIEVVAKSEFGPQGSLPNEVMVEAPLRVAIDNDLTDDLEFPNAERIGRVDMALSGQLSRSIQENARLKNRMAALESAAKEFIAKVDGGAARSVRSYAAFKAALEI